MTTMTRNGSAHPAPSASGAEHRVLYLLVFAVCLVLAALLRLAPRAWHPWIAQSERPMSLAAEARAAADSTVPYIFQVS